MIALLHRGTEIGAVQWSADDKIAVATPECIYVLTTVTGGRGETAELFHCRISIAPAPKPEALPDVGLPPCIPEYCVTSKDQRVRRFFDPVFYPTATTQDLLKASTWSPAGCTWLGGCVLACLSSSGRVLMFTPPSSIETRWKQMVDLTKKFCVLLKTCSYKIMELNRSDTRTSSVGVASAPPIEVSESKSGETFFTRRLMVAFTCCQWLPALVDGTAVVAVATRSGHLIVWGVSVPVVPEGRLSILSVIDVAAGRDMWACSMCWCLCNHEARLFVGCTNGSVYLTRWASCSDLLAGKMSPQEGTAEIWAADDIGVHQIVWQPDDQTLAISKGSMLVFLSVPPVMPSLLPTYTFCPGVHNLPISGLCALALGGFLSCSLDGSVRKCWVTPDGRCSSSVVPLEPLQHGHPYGTCGIATSAGSVFAAVVLRPNLELSRKGMKHSYVQFVKIADDGHVMRCLSEKGYQWDTGEYIRQFHMEHGTLPSFASAQSSSSNDLKLRRHLELITGSDATAASRPLQYQHVLSSLRLWVDWRGKGGRIEGDRGTVSLYNMVHLVQSRKDASEEEMCLAHKVSEMLPALRLGEFCPVCGCTVDDTAADGHCERRHPFQRCTITLCLTGEADTRWCIHCGAPSLRTDTVQQDSWLSYLLSRNTQCIFCGGPFEQLVR